MHYLLILCLLFALPCSATTKERVIAIGGDTCEIIYALNKLDWVVGREMTCLAPDEFKKIPSVGYMRKLNTEGILSLSPTLVIANGLAGPDIVFKQLKEMGVNVVLTPGEPTFANIPNKIRIIAKALGEEPKGNELALTFEQQLNELDQSPKPVRILMLMQFTGHSPIVLGKNSIGDEIIQYTGAVNAMESLSGFRPVSAEGIIAANPDVIVTTNLSIENIGGIDKLWDLPGMNLTNAAKDKRVIVLDDIKLIGFSLYTPDAIKQIIMEIQKIKQ